MTASRSDAARAFAEAAGLCAGCFSTAGHIVGPGVKSHDLRLPAPDAPLHEHLAFVGRIAEALGLKPNVSPFMDAMWCVSFSDWKRAIETDDVLATDIAWAALLAATAARAKGGEGRK